jgi:hypothetical protein
MSHTKPARKVHFNVSDHYEIIDVIGEGAYGVVWYDNFSASVTAADKD